jgi:hypothetical protein
VGEVIGHSDILLFAESLKTSATPVHSGESEHVAQWQQEQGHPTKDNQDDDCAKTEQWARFLLNVGHHLD